MLSVSCRDVGVDCDFRGTGETEEELMNNLVDHAIKDHGFTRDYVMTPEMQEKIKAKIKKSWKYGSAVGSRLSCLKKVREIRDEIEERIKELVAEITTITSTER